MNSPHVCAARVDPWDSAAVGMVLIGAGGVRCTAWCAVTCTAQGQTGCRLAVRQLAAHARAVALHVLRLSEFTNDDAGQAQSWLMTWARECQLT